VTRTTGVLGYGECPRCGGLFLTESAFDAVTHDADLRARVRVFEGALRSTAESLAPRFHYRSCPVCRKLMNRTNYAGGSGIIVDVCGYHGVWFDRGELTAIADFFEKGGWDRVKKRERERLEEDVRNLENRKSGGALGAMLTPQDVPSAGGELLREIVSSLGTLFRRGGPPSS
jgi:Zn-finger nucleic acid-binding protein